MESVRARLEWRGGMYEDFSTLEEAKCMIRRVYPRAAALPWETTEDGNYRQLNFLEQPGDKGAPVARILIPLTE
jgi:hypothetical protein